MWDASCLAVSGSAASLMSTWADGSSCLSACCLDSSLPVMMTWPPSVRMRRAPARPMPLVPPVIKMRLPWKRLFAFVFSLMSGYSFRACVVCIFILARG